MVVGILGLRGFLAYFLRCKKTSFREGTARKMTQKGNACFSNEFSGEMLVFLGEYTLENLNYKPNMMVLKMSFLSKWVIFRFYVSFQGNSRESLWGRRAFEGCISSITIPGVTVAVFG